VHKDRLLFSKKQIELESGISVVFKEIKVPGGDDWQNAGIAGIFY